MENFIFWAVTANIFLQRFGSNSRNLNQDIDRNI